MKYYIGIISLILSITCNAQVTSTITNATCYMSGHTIVIHNKQFAQNLSAYEVYSKETVWTTKDSEGGNNALPHPSTAPEFIIPVANCIIGKP